MRRGTVKFFNHDKGFGFINDNANNESVFVHIDGCNDPIDDNSKVVFEIKKGPKGPVAYNVTLKENYIEPVSKVPTPPPADGEIEVTSNENTEASDTQD